MGNKCFFALKGSPTGPGHWVPTHFIDMQPFILSYICFSLSASSLLQAHHFQFTWVISVEDQPDLWNIEMTTVPVRCLVWRTGELAPVWNQRVNVNCCLSLMMTSCFLSSSPMGLEKNTSRTSISGSKIEK